jgi:hypothetical protein
LILTPSAAPSSGCPTFLNLTYRANANERSGQRHRSKWSGILKRNLIANLNQIRKVIARKQN